jgi:cytochrome bd-type quinol oxidase subunit 2
MKNPYRRGNWDPNREQWPPYPSDGAWNQSWAHDPYAAYRIGQQPSSSYDWQRPARSRRPRSIQAAVVLMCLVAGLSGVSLAYNFITYHEAIEYGAIQTTGGSPELLEVASAVSGVGSLLISILAIALWLWMASATSAGRRWARTLSTVYFVFSTLSMAIFVVLFRTDWNLTSGHGQQSTALLAGIVTAGALWLLRLMIVVLLWSRESSDYYQAKAAGW